MSHPDDYYRDSAPITWRGWVRFIACCAFVVGGLVWKLSHDVPDDATPVNYACYDVPRDQYDGGEPDCEEGR